MNSPTVHTSMFSLDRGNSLHLSSIRVIISALAAMVSLLWSMGTVPAWPEKPSTWTYILVWPLIALTTPTGWFRDCNTGPCSMWTST